MAPCLLFPQISRCLDHAWSSHRFLRTSTVGITAFSKEKARTFYVFHFIDVTIYFNFVLVLFSNCFMMNLKLQNAEQRRCLCARCMYMMQTTTTNFKAFR